MDMLAVVVGGSSGIGLATARQLRDRGVTVHVVGRSKEKLDEIAASDPEIVTHQADGGDRAAIGAVFEAVGIIDYLVVSLSGAEGGGALADLDLEALRRAFDAKFWAHLTTVQVALPHLAEQGSITLLGAISAQGAMPGTAGLAAINGAIEAMVRPLAAELAPIRVNAVSRGLVDTPWWSGLPDDARKTFFDQMAATLPVRKVATAEDVAESVVLVATNTNMSGTIIQSDGGFRLIAAPGLSI
jgi:NAD(P)-dependent dehydrogenase (short-subunit alcohol dehydrogenase family)